MELQKALSTLKAVCDDSVSNGRFRSIDEVSAVTDAYNTIVGVCNYAVAKQKEEQADGDGGEIKEPMPDEEPSPKLVESES